MLVTTKGRYALRMMLNIASYGTDRKIALRQVAHSMVEVGLLTSARGHGGGYALARPASEIKIGDILRAAEDGITAVVCAGPDRKCPENKEECVLLDFWNGLNQIIDDYIDKPTLADMVTLRKSQ